MPYYAHPMSDVLSRLGGPAVVARIVGCQPPSVIEWRKRGIPPDRCPQLERASNGAVQCEEMRPDLHWVRVPDAEWPHPAGRPCLDVARLAPVAS